jgi:hypothetical protein
MADGNDGDTLLLPRAEFRTGNKLQLTHHDEELFVTLGKDVWHSEGFAQFVFSSQSVEQDDSESFEEYLMPA